MGKLDLMKQYTTYYKAKTKPELIEIEQAQFLSIIGNGDPLSDSYAKKIQSLYAVAYALKFWYKAKNKDFVVAKLEGQWWFNEKTYPGISLHEVPQKVSRSEWHYRLLIRIPEYITIKAVQLAIETVIAKKKTAFASEVETFTLEAGKAVQMLHLGSFDKEIETLLQMRDFITHNQLRRNGLHHEIYLSDFKKTAPEKLKTILREPVK